MSVRRSVAKTKRNHSKRYSGSPYQKFFTSSYFFVADAPSEKKSKRYPNLSYLICFKAFDLIASSHKQKGLNILMRAHASLENHFEVCCRRNFFDNNNLCSGSYHPPPGKIKSNFCYSNNKVLEENIANRKFVIWKKQSYHPPPPPWED